MKALCYGLSGGSKLCPCNFRAGGPLAPSHIAPTGANVAESPPAGSNTGSETAATNKGETTMGSGLPTTRSHQTALVIDVRNGTPGNFQNRYKRLLESVNGSNIKVDVFTLRGNATASGPGLVAGTPDTYVAPDSSESEIDLKAWAAELGYTQLLVSIPVAA